MLTPENRSVPFSELTPENRSVPFSELTEQDIKPGNRVTGFGSLKETDRFVRWLRKKRIDPFVTGKPVQERSYADFIFEDHLPSQRVMTGPLVKFTGHLGDIEIRFTDPLYWMVSLQESTELNAPEARALQREIGLVPLVAQPVKPIIMESFTLHGLLYHSASQKPLAEYEEMDSLYIGQFEDGETAVFLAHDLPHNVRGNLNRMMRSSRNTSIDELVKRDRRALRQKPYQGGRFSPR